MTAEAILAGLRSEGWSAAEWATDRGYTAEASEGERAVTVFAPASALAWALVWRCVVAAAVAGG